MFFSPLSSVHEVKSLIDLLKGQSVGNKLIHLQLLIQVVFHQFRNALHTLPPWGGEYQNQVNNSLSNLGKTKLNRTNVSPKGRGQGTKSQPKKTAAQGLLGGNYSILHAEFKSCSMITSRLIKYHYKYRHFHKKMLSLSPIIKRIV